MKKRSSWLMAAALSAAPAFGAAPAGWFKAGAAAPLYEAGVSRVAYRGARAAFFKSASPAPKGFGTLMQTVDASAFAGRRVRLSAAVQAEGVAGWAGLWMRVDGPYGKVQAFDNMQRRPIKGTTGWKRYEIVLDAPKTAQQVSFGLLLDGGGSLLLDQVAVEAVGTDVPVTAAPPSDSVRPRPENLDFEE